MVPDIGIKENIEVSWERLDMSLLGAIIKRENMIGKKLPTTFWLEFQKCLSAFPSGYKKLKEAYVTQK